MLSRSVLALGDWRISRAWLLTVRLLPILVFSALTAVSGQIKVELFFSPVPVSAQTLAVLLAGVCLGSRAGALAQIGYIGAGLLGFPVFVGGSSAWRIMAGGVPVIVGPTMGYLVGYIAAAFLVGLLVERGWERQPMSLFDALVLGNLVIDAGGALWLLRFVPGGLAGAVVVGVLPFLAGDLLKIVILAVSISLARWIVVGISSRLIREGELVPAGRMGARG